MLEPPYRALRILLGVFSLLAALGGSLMIFADKPLIRTYPFATTRTRSVHTRRIASEGNGRHGSDARRVPVAGST